MDSGGLTPHRGPVADLVYPYATKEDGSSEAIAVLTAWLTAHPGRWALFNEAGAGIDRKNLQASGYEVAIRTAKGSGIRRIYARLPHPDGEGLDEALARTQGGRYSEPSDLPVLLRDSFDWTKEELEAATRAAMESLFPVRAARGSGRRKR